jgi:ankyrin repeat protein
VITHPLYDPVHAGDINLLKSWLDKNPQDLNAPIGDGYSALHVACLFGHEILVSYLLDRHALVNLNAENTSGATPLHIAVMFRDTDIASRIATRLIDNGAELNAIQKGGQTPLHHAVARGSLKLVKLLVTAGADPFLKDEQGRAAADLAREIDSEDAALIREALKGAYSLTLETIE